MRQQQQQQQQQPPEAPLREPAFPAYPMLTTNLAWNSSVQIREHLSVTIEALDNMLADVINVRRALSRLSTRRPWPGGWSLNLLEMEIRDFMMGGGRMTLAEIHTRLDVEAANLRMRLEGLMLIDAEDLPPAHVIESEQGPSVPLTPTQRYVPPAPAQRKAVSVRQEGAAAAVMLEEEGSAAAAMPKAQANAAQRHVRGEREGYSY